MSMQLIHEHHWGGGYTKRWIDGKYLISGTYWTGSSIQVEELDFPGVIASGWFYCIESQDECIARLKDQIDHGWHHACWREQRTPTEGNRPTQCIKYISGLEEDLVSEAKIKEIENRPEFLCWEHINLYKFGNVVTKHCYDIKTFSYVMPKQVTVYTEK